MKRIGIIGWKSSDHFGVSIPYANYLSKFGQVVILSPSNEIDKSLDLVVLPGGPDLSAASLGNPPTFYNSNSCPHREYFYKVTLDKYLENKTPVFGICLGMQQLNVKLGGRLTQHYGFPYSDRRDELIEELFFTEVGVEFRKTINDSRKKVQVNSMHHQGVFTDQLAPNFKALAISASKNVEIMVHDTLKIAGVQYHPEELLDETIANNLIKFLLQK